VQASLERVNLGEFSLEFRPVADVEQRSVLEDAEIFSVSIVREDRETHSARLRSAEEREEPRRRRARG